MQRIADRRHGILQKKLKLNLCTTNTKEKEKNKTQAKLFNLKVNLLAVRSEIVLMPMIQFPPEQGLTELITT